MRTLCLPTILSYLRMQVCFLVILEIKMIVAYECDCMYMRVNFKDEILLKGEECKTREKLNFF